MDENMIERMGEERGERIRGNTYAQYRELVATTEHRPGLYVATDERGYYLQNDPERADYCAAFNAIWCALLMLLCIRYLRHSMK